MRSARCATVLVVALAALRAEGAGRVRSTVDAQRIGVEDHLQLTVTVEGAVPGDVPLPVLENLSVVGGPSVSTQISLVNGQMSQSRSTTWVLQAKAVGKAKIGEVKVGDEVAPSIGVEIVDGSIRPRPRARPVSPFGDPFEELLGRRQQQRPAADPRLFVEATISRTKLRVGEAARLTYWVYTQVPVSELVFAEPPQYPGVWVEDLKRDESPRTEAALRDGERFQKALVFDKLVFPTKSGKLVLPPAKFRISVPPQGFFDSGATVVRATKEVALEVEPLPERPGYSGAVGRFTARATLDRTELPLGEAATLRFRVEGTGNLKWIDKGPDLVVSGARVFPPQVRSEFKAGENGISGARTWEFVVVPETAGRIIVPALPFPYFDTASSRLVTTETAPLELVVQGGSGAVPALAVAPVATGGPRGAAPLPLRSALDAEQSWLPEIPVRALLFLTIAVVAGQLGFALAPMMVRRLGGGHAAMRGGGSARSALRDLERVARGGLAREEAVAVLEKALRDAFGDLPEDAAVDGGREGAARGLLDEVRFVRYAPQLGDYSETIRGIAARAIEAVRRWA